MRFRLLRALLLSLPLIAAAPMAQSGVTTPRAQFGFDIGDDYQLANYTKIAAYWRKLDAESDRLVVKEIGKTSEGRPQLMAIVTSPTNHKNLAKYQDIARRLALAEDLTPEAARTLARQGKAVVWIDGGLHANETLGAQQLVETIYQMVSRSDEETLRFLDECILLFVHANPDGNELVADWYMRNPDPLKRSAAGLPRLYHHYIGHDNNRDFFASTQAETENINRVLYHEWLPQILYNHHQSGPAGTVVWSSPQRDPYNYNLDPLLILGLQALGTHMHQRLASEGKPGATMASGGPYDGWWNGGIRNTGNFHNIIAILTETIGNPTPMRIPLVLERQIPNRDLPFPIAPQEWQFRQSIDYSISFNRAVIDYAARNREHLLYNIYAMGRRAIARGSEDSWTPSPTRIQALADQAGGGRGRGGSPERDAEIWAALRRPEHRDPRGYIIPSNQRDFLTAIKFVNALREVNVAVHRATKEFDVAGTRYPRGLVRRHDGAGVPAARARHVRTAGSSERDPVSRGAADTALRQRRLDAGVPDGRRVRARPGAVHRSVRARDRLERQAGGGHRRGRGRRSRLRHQPPGQRRRDRRQPPAARERDGSRRPRTSTSSPVHRPRAPCTASRRSWASTSPPQPPRHRPTLAASRHRGSACGISTADRWTRGGRAGCSSSTSSGSNASMRRSSTPATSTPATT